MHGTGDQERGAAIAEQGFMLLALIVAIFLMLLVLGMAAPQMARSLRRDREVEAVHRGDQYVRGIREFYIKNGNHYPGSMEQLEKTNNIRFLRQRYKDPITGKDDWRMIPVGQNKTTVKSFFGKPLGGLATTGLGSAAGLASPGIGQAGGIGANPGFGATGAAGGTTGANGAAGTTGVAGAGTGTGSTTGATDSTTAAGLGGVGSQPASGFSGTTPPFMGVGLSATGDSVVELNEQTSYQTWEFLYDPRIEQLKAKAGIGTGVGSAAAGALGQTPGAFGTPGTPSPAGTGSPGSPTTPVTPPFVGVPNLP